MKKSQKKSRKKSTSKLYAKYGGMHKYKKGGKVPKYELGSDQYSGTSQNLVQTNTGTTETTGTTGTTNATQTQEVPKKRYEGAKGMSTGDIASNALGVATGVGGVVTSAMEDTRVSKGQRLSQNLGRKVSGKIGGLQGKRKDARIAKNVGTTIAAAGAFIPLAGPIISAVGGAISGISAGFENKYDKDIAGAYGDYEGQLKQRDMMEDNAAKKRVENAKMQEYDYFSGMGNTQSARDGGLLKYGYGGKMEYQKGGEKDRRGVKKMTEFSNNFIKVAGSPVQGVVTVADKYMKSQHPAVANFPYEDALNYYINPITEKGGRGMKKLDNFLDKTERQITDTLFSKSQEKGNQADRKDGLNQYRTGGKLPKEVLESRLESHMSDSEAQDYIDSYKNGGLWANIHAKRARGEAPAKPGDEDYPTAKALRESKRDGGLMKYQEGGFMSPAMDFFRDGGETDIVYQDGGAGIVTPAPGALTRIEGGADHEEKNNLGVKGVPNGVPVAFDGNEVQGEVENREVIDDTSMTEEILEASTNRGGGLAKGPYMFSEDMGVDGSRGKNRTGPSYADARMMIAKLPPEQQMEATRTLMKSQEMASGDPARAAKAGTYRDGGIQKYQTGNSRGFSMIQPRGTFDDPVPQKQKFVSPFASKEEERAFQDYANAQEAGVTNGYGWGPKSAYAYGEYGDEFAKAQQNFNQNVAPITPTTWAQANTSPALAASTPTVPVASFNQGPLTRKGMRQQNRQQNLKDFKAGFNEYAGGAAALLGGVARAAALGSIDPNEAPPPVSARDVKVEKMYRTGVKDMQAGRREAELLAAMNKDKIVGDPTRRYNTLRQEGFRQAEQERGRIDELNAKMAYQYDSGNLEAKLRADTANQGKDLKTSESISRIMDKVIDTRRNQKIAGGEIFAQSMKDFQSWKANQDLTRAMEGDRNVMSNFYNNNYPAFARKFKKGNPNATALEINQAFLASV